MMIILTIALAVLPGLAVAQLATLSDTQPTVSHEDMHTTLAEIRVPLEAVLNTDFMANVSGGVDINSSVLGNVDVNVAIDTEKLFPQSNDPESRSLWAACLAFRQP